MLYIRKVLHNLSKLLLALHNILLGNASGRVEFTPLIVWWFICHCLYSKTCLKRPLKIDKTKVLMTNDSLKKVEGIAECSLWSILQYFWSALSNNLYWKPNLGVFFEWQLKTGFTVLELLPFVSCSQKSWWSSRLRQADHIWPPL